MEQHNTPALSNEESLRIITGMIQAAQGEIAHNAFDFIFWGWALVAASIAHYALLVLPIPISPGMVYLFLPLGGIYMWWYHRHEEKKEQVHTHIDLLMPYVCGAFGATMVVGIFFCAYLNVSSMPWILLFVGTATFITGGALKFRPLMVGGASFWVFALVSMFQSEVGQIACQAAAMVVGYLVPGYMLMRQHRTANV